MKKNIVILLTLCLVLYGFSLAWYPPADPIPTNDLTPIYSNASNIHFAIIGDFGRSGQPEADVANQIKLWDPDFIVTTGDNNYSQGSPLTINKNVAQYYSAYVGAYRGWYGIGPAQNRFFPALGNHDWHSISCTQDQCQGAYLSFFSLPGNERYYDFIWGPIHFFMLDSDPHEPDGTTFDSVQGQWLKEQLSISTSSWNVIITHHPPFSSGAHGSSEYMQWPFKEWGADIVISGHDHNYERLFVGELPYIVNGSGGQRLYDFETPLLESLVRYNQDYGAVWVEASPERLTFQFITRTGELVDQFTLYSQP